MGSNLLRNTPLLRVAVACALTGAFLAGSGEMAPAAPAGGQQTPSDMLFGTVAADWSWEPAPVPASPADIHPPELLRQTVPGFPSAARAREGYQGHVIVEATIGISGRIRDPRIVRTPAAGVFDSAVLTALRQWTFRPATDNGIPVEVTGLFTFSFNIEVSGGAQQAAEKTGLRANAVRMGESGLVPPRQLTTELPEYTAAAKQSGVQGDVYVEAVVTKEGTVAEPRLVRGLADEELNRRAIEAVTQWTFEPGSRGDEPVDVLALFTVAFQIH